jgi:glutamate decarboxylase
MPDQFRKQTPYDQFNFEIPQKFPEQGVSAAAANAIVNSETWTEANPMLNLSSFVTTYCEPEAKDLYDLHMFRNFADPDMYPHTAETESQCVQWLHDLWNVRRAQSPTGPRLSVLPKPVCWAAWPTNGIGGRRGRRRASYAT